MSTSPTDRRGAFAVFLVALAVRWLWMPHWALLDDPRGLRRVFDGHERAYLQAFEGGGLADPSTSFNPIIGGLSAAAGAVWSNPAALVIGSGMVGALAAVGVAVWTGRQFGASAGRWAGLLVALLPEHAAWSTSVYPVILPHALLVGAFVARRPLPAAVLSLAAGLLRPELAVLALFRGAPGIAAWAGAAGWLWMAGGAPVQSSFEYLPTVLRLNLPMVEFLGPSVLVLALTALVDRRAWPVAALVVVNHLMAAGFDDQGARHVLMGGTALCVLGGVAVARHGWLIGVAMAAALAIATGSVSAVWAQPPSLQAEARDLPPLQAECHEVSDEPVLAGQAVPSHLLLGSGGPVATCVVWGEEAAHRAWSSRGLRDRARRMRAHYEPTAMAASRVPGGWRVYHRLTLPSAAESP